MSPGAPGDGWRRAGGSRTGRRWTAADVPGQAGRVAVVTGANTGIGFETARVLAGRGATVVLACRDVGKGKAAAGRIGAAAGGAPGAAPGGAGARGRVVVTRLDLASLASVREAAREISAQHQRIDLLVNNAGVMMPPPSRTADGFELQFGTNHLGHFALTGLLLGRLLAAGTGSRVVTVASNAHRAGRVSFDDLQWRRRRYRRFAAYGQSKLANLLFTCELAGRLAGAGAATVAVAAHPGTAGTDLVRYLPAWMRLGSALTPHQNAAMGALPTLRAATDPLVRGGEYYGPAGRGGLTGYPVLAASSARSRDAQTARRLFEVSAELTGVRYEGLTLTR